MTKTIAAIRGMNDILPEHMPYWHFLEDELRKLAYNYGYREIRFPIVESTALFQRGIGEGTDIIEKEMYTFEDRHGDSLSMRPEGTASCVRAGIQHGLLYNQQQRLWYLGPMFRYERPQKGRYRQFHHFGLEAYGMQGPDIDAELLLMTARLWQTLGIQQHVRLQLNTLGSAESRSQYREQLVAYFSKHSDALDEDSKRRLTTNPLRILDSKNPDMQSLIANAPTLMDYLDETAKQHFAKLRTILDANKIAYEVNPRLVRGLDYYSYTVFEWITTHAGAQNAVCAGGRYDALVEQLGGKATPAVGLAMGLERLIALLEAEQKRSETVDAYLIMLGDEAEREGVILAEKLRDRCPDLSLMVNAGGGNLAAQLKRADKNQATFALIIGSDEIQAHKITVKFLREATPQVTLKLVELEDFLLDRL